MLWRSTHLGLPPAGQAQALVDSERVYAGSFQGWGTALAWGGNVVGGWSDPNRTAIADLLFSPLNGLGLNIIRYHIGGGLNPDWQAIGCGPQRPGSPLPLYQPSPGVWDWTVQQLLDVSQGLCFRNRDAYVRDQPRRCHRSQKHRRRPWQGPVAIRVRDQR